MTHPESLEPRRRALEPSEKRLLATRIKDLRAQSSGPAKTLLVSVIVVAALYALTLAVADAPLAVVTLFWLVVGGLISLWVWYDARRDVAHAVSMAGRLASAGAADLAEVYDIRCARYVEFAEFEDEGACYAFEIEANTLVFVHGQEFYRSARFPSLDFSLVFPLDETGARVDMWIQKRGPTATPHRVISSDVKWRLDLPENLGVIRADPDRVESVLSEGPPR